MTKSVVVLTGASSGIGEATARLLAQIPNLSLVLVARNQQKLKQLAQDLKQTRDLDVLVYPLDLTQLESIPDLVEAVRAKFGRLDVLLHVAGMGDFKPALEQELKNVETQFQVNTLSGIVLLQAVGRQMVTQGEGKLLVVASMSAKLPTPQSSVYAASKSAINTYASVLGMELEPLGIPVTVVNPGPVRTPFFKHSSAMQDYIKNVDRFAMDADQVAQKLVDLVVRTGSMPREVNLPFTMRLAYLGQRFFPGLARWLTLRFANFK